jgi:hypothetical protein
LRFGEAEAWCVVWQDAEGEDCLSGPYESRSNAVDRFVTLMGEEGVVGLRLYEMRLVLQDDLGH